MGNFQASRPKKITPRVKAWAAIFFLLTISVILGKATWSIYNKNSIARENKLAATRELSDLEHRQEIIKAKLDKLKTVEGREEEIRKNLPMAKEGEYVITIVDDKIPTTGSDTGATTTVKKGFWQMIFGNSN